MRQNHQFSPNPINKKLLTRGGKLSPPLAKPEQPIIKLEPLTYERISNIFDKWAYTTKCSVPYNFLSFYSRTKEYTEQLKKQRQAENLFMQFFGDLASDLNIRREDEYAKQVLCRVPASFKLKFLSYIKQTSVFVFETGIVLSNQLMSSALTRWQSGCISLLQMMKEFESAEDMPHNTIVHCACEGCGVDICMVNPNQEFKCPICECIHNQFNDPAIYALSAIRTTDDYYVAGLLEELMALNYGDVYDDLTQPSKDSLLAHDKLVLTKYLSGIKTAIYSVPYNCPPNALNLISENNPIKVYKVVKNMNRLEPIKIATHGALVSWCVTNCPLNDIFIADSINQCITLKKTHFIHTELLSCQLHDNSCFSFTTCDHAIPSKYGLVLCSPDIKRHHTLILNSTLCYWIIPEDCDYLQPILIHVDDSPNPRVYVAKPVFQLCGTLVCLIQLAIFSPTRIIASYEMKSITIPISDPTSAFYGLPVVGDKMLKVPIDKHLLRILLVSCMRGEHDVNHLKSLAAGFNQRKHVVGSIIVKGDALDYQSVIAHVCLAVLYYHKVINTGHLTATLLSVKNLPVNLTVLMGRMLSDLGKNLLAGSLSAGPLNGPLSMLHGSTLISQFIEENMKHGCIDDLLDVTQNWRVVPYIQNANGTSAIPPIKCMHHEDMCGHDPSLTKTEGPSCLCCTFARTNKNSLYCKCCAKTQLDPWIDYAPMDDKPRKIDSNKQKPKSNKPQSQPATEKNPIRKLTVSKMSTTTGTVDSQDATYKNVLLNVHKADQMPGVHEPEHILPTIISYKMGVPMVEGINSSKSDLNVVLQPVKLKPVVNAEGDSLKLVPPTLIIDSSTNDLSVEETNITIKEPKLTYKFNRPLKQSDQNIKHIIRIGNNPLGIDMFNIDYNEVIHLPNSSVDSCAYEAYKFVSATRLSLMTFEQISQSQAPFSFTDLATVAQADNKTIVIVTPEHYMMSCWSYCYSLPRYCIVHSLLVGGHEGPDHWYPCPITWTEKAHTNLLIPSNQLCFSLPKPGYAQRLLKRMGIVGIPVSLHNGLLTVNNDSVYETGVKLNMNFGMRPSSKYDLFNEVANYSKSYRNNIINGNITSLFTINSLLCCTNLRQLESERINYKISRAKYFQINPTSIYIFNDYKLSLHDIIFVKKNDNGALAPLHVVAKHKRLVLLTSRSQWMPILDSEAMDLLLPRNNVSVCIKTIVCNSMILSGKNSETERKGVALYLGPPGTGKTTVVINKFAETHTFVSISAKRCREISASKGVKSCQPHQMVSGGNYIIDEIFTFAWHTIAGYIQSANSIVGTGDPGQISHINFTVRNMHAEAQSYESLFKDVIHLNEEFRFGPNVCQHLQGVYNGLHSSLQDTEVVTLHIDVNTKYDAVKQLLTDRPNTILLCMYNGQLDDFRTYCNIKPNQGDTVHSFQGKECDNVVLYLNNHPTFMTLTHDIRYLTVAFTRMKKTLVVLLENYDKSLTDALSLLDTTGSGLPDLPTSNLQEIMYALVCDNVTYTVSYGCTYKSRSDLIQLSIGKDSFYYDSDGRYFTSCAQWVVLDMYIMNRKVATSFRQTISYHYWSAPFSLYLNILSFVTLFSHDAVKLHNSNNYEPNIYLILVRHGTLCKEVQIRLKNNVMLASIIYTPLCIRIMSVLTKDDLYDWIVEYITATVTITDMYINHCNFWSFVGLYSSASEWFSNSASSFECYNFASGSLRQCGSAFIHIPTKEIYEPLQITTIRKKMNDSMSSSYVAGVPGLTMPIEDHVRLGTNVGRIYSQVMLQLKSIVSTKTYEVALVTSMSAVLLDNMPYSIRPNLSYSVMGRGVSHTPYMDIIDTIALSDPAILCNSNVPLIAAVYNPLLLKHHRFYSSIMLDFMSGALKLNYDANCMGTPTSNLQGQNPEHLLPTINFDSLATVTNHSIYLGDLLHVGHPLLMKCLPKLCIENFVTVWIMMSQDNIPYLKKVDGVWYNTDTSEVYRNFYYQPSKNFYNLMIIDEVPYEVSIITYYMGRALVQIRPVHSANLHNLQIRSLNMEIDNITILYPYMNLDILSWFNSNKNVLEVRKYKINAHIYSMISNKLVASNMTLAECLEYASMIGSVKIINAMSIYAAYEYDIGVLCDSAYVAYVEHTHALSTVNLVLSAFNSLLNSINSSNYDHLLTGLLTNLAAQLADIGISALTLLNEIKPMFDAFVKNNKDMSQWASKFMDAYERLMSYSNSNAFQNIGVLLNHYGRVKDLGFLPIEECLSLMQSANEKDEVGKSPSEEMYDSEVDESIRSKSLLSYMSALRDMFSSCTSWMFVSTDIKSRELTTDDGFIEVDALISQEYSSTSSSEADTYTPLPPNIRLPLPIRTSPTYTFVPGQWAFKYIKKLGLDLKESISRYLNILKAWSIQSGELMKNRIQSFLADLADKTKGNMIHVYNMLKLTLWSWLTDSPLDNLEYLVFLTLKDSHQLAATWLLQPSMAIRLDGLVNLIASTSICPSLNMLTQDYCNRLINHDTTVSAKARIAIHTLQVLLLPQYVECMLAPFGIYPIMLHNIRDYLHDNGLSTNLTWVKHILCAINNNVVVLIGTHHLVVLSGPDDKHIAVFDLRRIKVPSYWVNYRCPFDLVKYTNSIVSACTHLINTGDLPQALDDVSNYALLISNLIHLGVLHINSFHDCHLANTMALRKHLNKHTSVMMVEVTEFPIYRTVIHPPHIVQRCNIRGFYIGSQFVVQNPTNHLQLLQRPHKRLDYVPPAIYYSSATSSEEESIFDASKSTIINHGIKETTVDMSYTSDETSAVDMPISPAGMIHVPIMYKCPKPYLLPKHNLEHIEPNSLVHLCLPDSNNMHQDPTDQPVSTHYDNQVSVAAHPIMPHTVILFGIDRPNNDDVQMGACPACPYMSTSESTSSVDIQPHIHNQVIPTFSNHTNPGDTAIVASHNLYLDQDPHSIVDVATQSCQDVQYLTRHVNKLPKIKRQSQVPTGGSKLIMDELNMSSKMPIVDHGEDHVHHGVVDPPPAIPVYPIPVDLKPFNNLSDCERIVFTECIAYNSRLVHEHICTGKILIKTLYIELDVSPIQFMSFVHVDSHNTVLRLSLPNISSLSKLLTFNPILIANNISSVLQESAGGKQIISDLIVDCCRQLKKCESLYIPFILATDAFHARIISVNGKIKVTAMRHENGLDEAGNMQPQFFSTTKFTAVKYIMTTLHRESECTLLLSGSIPIITLSHNIINKNCKRLPLYTPYHNIVYQPKRDLPVLFVVDASGMGINRVSSISHAFSQIMIMTLQDKYLLTQGQDKVSLIPWSASCLENFLHQNFKACFLTYSLLSLPVEFSPYINVVKNKMNDQWNDPSLNYLSDYDVSLLKFIVPSQVLNTNSLSTPSDIQLFINRCDSVSVSSQTVEYSIKESVYNPTEGSDCLPLCLLHLLNNNKVDGYTYDLVVSRLRSQGVNLPAVTSYVQAGFWTYPTIICTSINIGYNVSPGLQEVLLIKPSNSSPGSFFYHAIIAKVNIVIQSKMPTPLITASTVEMNKIIKKAFQNSISDISTYMLLTQRDFISRCQLTNYKHNVIRSHMEMLQKTKAITGWTDKPFSIITAHDTPQKLLTNTLLCMSMRSANVPNCGKVVVLYLIPGTLHYLAPVPPSSWLLPMKSYKSKNYLKSNIHDQIIRMYPLNNASRPNVSVIEGRFVGNRLAVMGDRFIYIMYYDNRSHHMIREFDILYQADCQHIVCGRESNIIKTKAFKQSFDHASRLILIDGHVRWIHPPISKESVKLLLEFNFMKPVHNVSDEYIINPLINETELDNWLIPGTYGLIPFMYTYMQDSTTIKDLYESHSTLNTSIYLIKLTNGKSFIVDCDKLTVKPNLRGGASLSVRYMHNYHPPPDFQPSVKTYSRWFMNPTPIKTYEVNTTMVKWVELFSLLDLYSGTLKQSNLPTASVEAIHLHSDRILDDGSLKLSENNTPTIKLAYSPSMIMEPISTKIMLLWRTTLSIQSDIIGYINHYPLRYIDQDNMPRKQTVIHHAPYPRYTKPILVKSKYADINSIQYRFGGKVTLRKFSLNASAELDVICKTFFISNYKSIISGYQSDANYLLPSESLSREWIKQHHLPARVDQELDWLLRVGLFKKSFSDVNIHIKAESIIKDDIWDDWYSQNPRIIVWQMYAVASIFTPVFQLAKSRLKQLMKHNIIYTDGLDPATLNNKLKLISNGVKWFMEDDASKQDRQTDSDLLAIEMEIYLLLGIHPKVVNAWKMVHEQWRYKSRFAMGRNTMMRHTGAPTTAIGNVIVNMITHSRLINRMGSSFKFMLILGDDNVMGTTTKPDKSKHENTSAILYNMKTTTKVSNQSASYVGMVLYRTEHGYCQLGPNIVRLSYKYEVSNTVSDATLANIIARCQSYAMLLGPLPSFMQVEELRNLPFVDYYDLPLAISAAAHLYGLNDNVVEQELRYLISNILTPMVYAKTFNL